MSKGEIVFHYQLKKSEVYDALSAGRQFYAKGAMYGEPLATVDAIRDAFRRDGEVVSR